jgi:hypothetical protein
MLTTSMEGSEQARERGPWSAPCPQYTTTLEPDEALNAADAVEARTTAAAAARERIDGDMIIGLE